MTKKIPTILGLLLLGGVIGLIFYLTQNKPKVSSGIVPEKVRITNVADNKFSVSWTTKEATKGSLEYGSLGQKLGSTAKDERDATGASKDYVTHQVTVEGLQPATQYSFRIVSGANTTRFDNNGTPYVATTGPVIGATPPSINYYGKVELASKQPAEGAIVYVTLPGSATASTIVSSVGNYAITLSTIRSSNLKEYIKFDPSATIASMTVEMGKEQSTANVSLANAAPVPTITLGQNGNFLNPGETPSIAEVAPIASPIAQTTQAETPSIFNVEPMTPAIDAVSTTAVTLTNPKDAGEVIKTLKPEFRGTGPAGTTLSIALKGQKAVSDVVVVTSDKTWSWSPQIDLKTGKQSITVSYIDTAGTNQKIEREFTISTSTTGVDPAFVSSPSASIKASASASPIASIIAAASSSPRITMPDTDKGVPVTGVIENTLLTGALGIVIMVIGAALLSL